MHGLGRIVSEDERDRSYPMRTLLAAPPVRQHRHWHMHGAWLDQGATGTCVGHAWAHYTEDGPVWHPGTIDPIAIYVEATKVDEWTDNDNGDLNFGTSVRAGAKVLQARGIIAEYRWAWDVNTVIDAVLTLGPVVVGTNWYDSMFDVGAQGLIKVEGPVVGGHAYVINGVNLKRGVVRIKNSWGRAWGWGNPGKKGFAFLSLEDMDRLIQEDGEACIATEVKKGQVAW